MADSARSDRWIFVIGMFKLLKALAVGALGVGALLARGTDPATDLRHVVVRYGLAPGSHLVHALLARASGLHPQNLPLAAGVLLAYAAVFVVEGTALLLRQRWGEYLTVVVTGSLVPFEAYEIAQHVTALRVAGLALNVAVVAYLVAYLRRPR
jgi:uncharacterized membrane protein (DUF2068 family)